jgi:hypothetical protein
MTLHVRPLGRGKARLTSCSVEYFGWVSGQRAYGVLWVLGFMWFDGLRAFRVLRVFLLVLFGFLLGFSCVNCLCIWGRLSLFIIFPLLIKKKKNCTCI